jgi:hypothetical protein
MSVYVFNNGFDVFDSVLCRKRRQTSIIIIKMHDVCRYCDFYLVIHKTQRSYDDYRTRAK